MEKLLPLLAVWGVWIFSALALGALAGIWLLGRGRRLFVPARWPGRILAVLLLALAGVSGLLLYGIRGPLAPMLGQVRRVQQAVDRPVAELQYRAVADDAPHRLSELRGSVVILHLWATWCPPCRKELPDLDRLQKNHAGNGLVVVTLSNEERAHLQEFAAKYPTSTLNVYTADLDWMEVDGRPLTFVIDRQGVVRACFIGSRSYDVFEGEVAPWLEMQG